MSQQYRIDDLARLAGTTVRNVRVYQDRGLLPPPRREGRVGWYDEAHLARLRLIGQLLERGYTFAHIAELVTAWEQGRNLGDVLGLERALTDPWSDELPGWIDAVDLDTTIGSPEMVRLLLDAGMLVAEGERYRVPSPRLLQAGLELLGAGIPLDAVLTLLDTVTADVDHSARALVQTVAAHLLADKPPGWLPTGDEVPELAALILRLRPLAQSAVDALLAVAMERQVRHVLGEKIADVLGEHAREAH